MRSNATWRRPTAAGAVARRRATESPTPSTTTTSGSGRVQGELWGTRATDWAELDVGCATGVFLRAAADAGARVSGLDASAALLELARSRVPEADLRLGDLQFLPYDSGAFDAVTGFNSFGFAADPIDALREAGRVAKPGAPVLALAWGRPERCELGPLLRAVAPRRKPSPYEPGKLERMAAAAGLTPRIAGDLVGTLEFADDATLVRQLSSPASMVRAARAATATSATSSRSTGAAPRPGTRARRTDLHPQGRVEGLGDRVTRARPLD